MFSPTLPIGVRWLGEPGVVAKHALGYECNKL